MEIKKSNSETGGVSPIGSPRTMYTYFLLSLAHEYFTTMKNGESGDTNIDRATAALIAFCPNREMRENLWQFYSEGKKDAYGNKNLETASVHVIGELISYLNEVLEFEENVSGGVL
ncbi:MAG: hypothetical protein PHR19_08550 [Bacteroidales bacterium]|nr:hypothetical protein [Bacteroidales bacterium]